MTNYDGLSPYIADSLRQQELEQEQARTLRKTLNELNLSEERARLLQKTRSILGGASPYERTSRLKEAIRIDARHKRYAQSPQSREALYHRDNGRCYICDEEVGFEDMHLDHVVPLARGGHNRPDNLRVACQMCNTAKGSMMLSEYLATIGRSSMYD